MGSLTRRLQLVGDSGAPRRPDCAVCGGPGPDGSGCEFCPAVTLGIADEYGSIWSKEPGAEGSRVIGDLVQRADHETLEVQIAPDSLVQNLTARCVELERQLGAALAASEYWANAYRERYGSGDHAA